MYAEDYGDIGGGADVGIAIVRRRGTMASMMNFRCTYIAVDDAVTITVKRFVSFIKLAVNIPWGVNY